MELTFAEGRVRAREPSGDGTSRCQLAGIAINNANAAEDRVNEQGELSCLARLGWLQRVVSALVQMCVS